MSFRPLAFASTVVVSLLTGCQQTPDGTMAIAKDKIDSKAPAEACAGDNDCDCDQKAHPAEERVDIDVPSHAPRRGTAQAPVTMVVFSDFECAFCGRAAGTIEALQERYGDRLQVVFRQLPLAFHKKAQLAAEASLAAHEQGRFWAYHDRLFANPDALDRSALEAHAAAVGLDVTRFRAALDDGRHRTAVEADKVEAARLGVQGTPAFFINGTRVVGAQPVEKFAEVIDAALSASSR